MRAQVLAISSHVYSVVPNMATVLVIASVVTALISAMPIISTVVSAVAISSMGLTSSLLGPFMLPLIIALAVTIEAPTSARNVLQR